MRAVLVLLMAVCVASAQTCPPFPQLSDNGPYTEHWFAGSIGKRDVRMSLSRGGDAVVGVLYYTDNWVPLQLGGKWEDGDVVEMHDVIRCPGPSGYCSDDSPLKFGDSLLKGRLREQGFVGAWQAKEQEPAMLMNLKKVSEPSCNGDGPRRVFKNPEWPLTFSYPASWHLEVKTERLTLTCPDPLFMAYDDLGTIEIIKGDPSSEDGSGDIPIQKCKDKWVAGLCDCGEFCPQAAGERVLDISQKHGMTIINPSDESWWVRRLSCTLAGYAGIEDGDDVVLVVGKQMVWITGGAQTLNVAKSLLDSARPRR